jgi:hypothetical protein
MICTACLPARLNHRSGPTHWLHPPKSGCDLPFSLPFLAIIPHNSWLFPKVWLIISDSLGPTFSCLDPVVVGYMLAVLNTMWTWKAWQGLLSCSHQHTSNSPYPASKGAESQWIFHCQSSLPMPPGGRHSTRTSSNHPCGLWLGVFTTVMIQHSETWMPYTYLAPYSETMLSIQKPYSEKKKCWYPCPSMLTRMYGRRKRSVELIHCFPPFYAMPQTFNPSFHPPTRI